MRLRVLTATLVLGMLVFPFFAYAEGEDASTSTKKHFAEGIEDQTTAFVKGVPEPKAPQAFAATLISSLLGALGMLVLAYAIYGGYLIMTAAGNEDRVTKGRTVLVNSAIGTAVILSSYAIAIMMQNFFKDSQPHNGCTYQSDPTVFQDPLAAEAGLQADAIAQQLYSNCDFEDN